MCDEITINYRFTNNKLSNLINIYSNLDIVTKIYTYIHIYERLKRMIKI